MSGTVRLTPVLPGPSSEYSSFCTSSAPSSGACSANWRIGPITSRRRSSMKLAAPCNWSPTSGNSTLNTLPSMMSCRPCRKKSSASSICGMLLKGLSDDRSMPVKSGMPRTGVVISRPSLPLMAKPAVKVMSPKYSESLGK